MAKRSSPLMQAVTLAAALFAGAAQAQDAAPQLSIELNAAQDTEQGCKLSFMVLNTHPADLTKAVFETVIFDAAGQVLRLTLFDFGTLPTSRPRVRQFVIPGNACADLGQILFNGAHACSGEGLTSAACTQSLNLKTRTEQELLG